MKLFSLANEERVFVKKETVEGVLEYPGAANAVLVTGAMGVGSEIEFIDDAQLRGGRSRLRPIKGRTHPGSWSMTTYAKPSGALGVVPETDVLFECLMGKKEINSGVSVVYSLDSSLNLPSFSLWVKKGHTVFALEGCTVNQAELNISGGEIVGVNWSGNFMQWYRGGYALTTAIVATSATTLTVDDATRFSGPNRMKISIGDDTNTGAGYTVTAINYTTKVITFSPGLVGAGEASGAVVQGWVPATSTEVGSPIHGKITDVTIDTFPATLLSSRVSIVNNLKYYEDEMNGEWFANAYGTTGFRQIEGSLGLFFRKHVSTYFYKSEYQIQGALLIKCGPSAGNFMEVSLPHIEYRTPTLSGDEEVLMDIPFIAVATAALDDEASITFK